MGVDHLQTNYVEKMEIMEKFLETWDKIVERESAKDAFFKKVVESQRKYTALMVPYRLSTWLPYDMAGNHYWKSGVWQASGVNGAGPRRSATLDGCCT